MITSSTGVDLEQDLPRDKDAEITGPMTTTFELPMKGTEGKDTDWNIM